MNVSFDKLTSHISLDGETVKSTRRQNRFLRCIQVSLLCICRGANEPASVSSGYLVVPMSLGSTVRWLRCVLLTPNGQSRRRALATRRHTKTREATSERHSPLSVRRSLLDSRVVSLFALLIPSISTLHHICCQKSSPYVLQRIAAKITESPLLREVVFGSGQWPNLIHH